MRLRVLLASLVALACRSRTAYLLEDNYSGPVVVIFAVPGAKSAKGPEIRVDRAGAALIGDSFTAGDVSVERGHGGARVPVAHDEILGFASSDYAGCDSSGDSLRSVSFFVGREDHSPNWKRDLDRARLTAIASALEKAGRLPAAACARRESADIR